MSELKDLYQQIIIDHSQHPHNFCAMENSTATQEGFNPLCGDHLFLYVNKKNNVIENVSFQGSGCAISTASASLMTDIIKGKTVQEALQLVDDLQQIATTGKHENMEKLGKLAVLAGVSEYPMRVKCATLPWHTLKAALTK